MSLPGGENGTVQAASSDVLAIGSPTVIDAVAGTRAGANDAAIVLAFKAWDLMVGRALHADIAENFASRWVCNVTGAWAKLGDHNSYGLSEQAGGGFTAVSTHPTSWKTARGSVSQAGAVHIEFDNGLTDDATVDAACTTIKWRSR